jgi:hypothetical protein
MKTFKFFVAITLLLNVIIINQPDDVVVCTETHGVTICN